MTGVEDMQVQLGVDTDLPGTANRGAIDRYVNAERSDTEPGECRLHSVRRGFGGPHLAAVARGAHRKRLRRYGGYVYADQNVPAFNDGFRRIVVSKTIYIRNARPAT